MEKIWEILLTDPNYESVRWPVLASLAIFGIVTIASKVVDISYKRVRKRKLEAEILRKSSKSPGQPENATVPIGPQPEATRRITPNDKQLVQLVLVSILSLDFVTLRKIATDTDSLELGRSILGIRVVFLFLIPMLATLPPFAVTSMVAIPAFGLISRYTQYAVLTFVVWLPAFLLIALSAGGYAARKTFLLVADHGLKDDQVILRIQIRSLWLGTLGIAIATAIAFVI